MSEEAVMSIRSETPVVPVGEMLRSAYAAHADRCAVAGPGSRLTYAELRGKSLRIARALRDRGVVAGDRLLILAHNTVDWVVTEHACYAGGFGRVAALPRLHPNEIAQIAVDAEPSVVVVEASWLESNGRDWIPATVEHLVILGGDSGALSLAELEDAGSEEELEPRDPDDLCWLMYTSGSTGLPKGVRQTHHTLGAMVRNINDEMSTASADDVMLHSAPIGHFSGGCGLANYALGGANHMMEAFDPGAIATAISEDGITILPLVPTQIAMLTEDFLRRKEAGTPVDTSSVHLIPYAGSAIPPDRLAQARNLFGNVLLQFYGSSEVPMPMTALQSDAHTDEVGSTGMPRLASAGRPNRYVELRILGDDGSVLGAGEPGEIAARGENVTVGYWRNQEATDEVLDADGWWRTGDVGVFDDDGFLFIVDRKKDMVITGGFNVFTREVENVISTLEGIREVAVLGAPSERWGEEITAFVSLQDDATIDEAQVIEHCRARIGGYKVPKRVVILDDLPKSGAGKIQKPVLRDELWAGRERRV